MDAPNPVYLLADSELLFWMDESILFLKMLLRFVSDSNPSASYIGASNDDRPEYYDIFCAAMDKIAITERRMIRQIFTKDDQDFLNRSSIVLLAGGDAIHGWNLIMRSGLSDAVRTRYTEGAVLIGVSAGAVQLGLGILSEDERTQGQMWIETLQIVPFVVGVREEMGGWKNLEKAVRVVGARGKGGIGIPAGGGAVYYPDDSLKPVRRAIAELQLEGEEIRSGVLLPDATHAKSFCEH